MPNDLGRLRADKLDVEFSLGDLMRGEWRANELTVSGMSADLGIDSKGRLDLPSAGGRFNLASLSIDRFNLTGRVALHDATSHGTIELNDIVFSGDVRSLAGSLRGDGSVSIAGTRYPFRASSSQDKDSSGLRVHLNVDPGERPLAADIEGLISFGNRAPRFDGAVTLSSPPLPKEQGKEQAKEQVKEQAKQPRAAKPSDAAAQVPWRVAAKVAADPAGARLDQIETSFGNEDRALKFTGSGDVRFGASPLLRATLSARQLDADKLLAADDGKAMVPARLLPALRTWLAALPALPLPANIQFSTEQIMLAGRPIQNLVADLHNAAGAWSLDKVDLRAPGMTHLAFKSASAPGAAVNGFAGALDLDSSDPDALMAWLQGRSEISYRSQKPLRLRGDLRVASDRVAIEGLKADMEGGAVEGRLALINAQPGAGSRFEVALKGERLDLDAAAALARSLVGPAGDWPEAAAISLDIGRAVVSGQELRPLTAKASYDPQSIVIDQLTFGQGSSQANGQAAGAVTTEGSGRFDRIAATGRLALSASAGSLHDITALLQPFAPKLAARFDSVATAPGSARLKLALDLAKDFANADHANARVVVDLDAPQFKGTTTLTARPMAAALRSFDLEAVSHTEVGVETRMSAEQGNALLAVFGLDRVAAAGNGPAQFEANATGIWRAPLRLSAKISGIGLDGDAQGTAEPWSDTAKASLNLRVRSVNLAPLVGLKEQDPAAQNVRLFGRLVLSGDRLTLDDLDGVAGGARLRGRLVLTLGDDKQLEGEVGLDLVDIPQLFALGIGAAGHDAAEPLGPGLLRGGADASRSRR